MPFSGLASFHNHLTIQSRINILVSLTILCVVVLGITHFLGDRAVRHATEQQNRYAKLVKVTGEIQTAALALAAAESDFLLHFDKANARKYEKSALAVLRLLEDIPENVVHPRISPAVERTTKLVIDHLSDFRTIARFFKQMDPNEDAGPQGEWREAAHEAEAGLRNAGREALLVKLLMMRRHEKDFLLRGRAEHIEAFNSRSEELFRQIRRADISGDLRIDLTKQIDTYRRSFTNWAEFWVDLKIEIDRQTKNSQNLAPAFQAVNSMAAALHEEATADLRAAQSQTNRWFTLIAAGVLSIAAFLGLLIGRGITKPLRALTATVTALAQGDLQQRIPSAKNRDEIGDIARALHVFRDNAMARERLEAEGKIERATRRMTEKDTRERLEAHARDMADLAQQYEIARSQAESANRMKSEFLATMSHELRTPLNAIIGFSEILQMQSLGPLGNDQYREYVGDIGSSGKHLLQLINDILDLSKIESGLDSLDETDIALPLLVKTIQMMVQQRAHKGGVTLVTEVPDDLPALRADERKIKQILLNLSTNAVKFTEPGGQVTIKGWAKADGGLVLEVVDTGVGIAPEDISKAMAQFGQVDGSLNHAHEGTGLGLPLTKALVEQHGGTLELRSELGVGTTVTATFPTDRLALATAA